MKSKIEQKLENGQSFYWDYEGELSRESFIEIAFKSIQKEYCYDYLIELIKHDGSVVIHDDPDGLTICKGKEELMKQFLKLSGMGYFCKVKKMDLDAINLLKITDADL